MSSEISLVMMVKDEENNLPRLLKSIEGLYDEFVAVDTGSRDKTVDILKGAGARIIHSPWRKDFSFHRNEGIKAATGEWILNLDADEELDKLSKQFIRKIPEEAKDVYHSAWFTLRSFTVMGNYSQSSSVRMFRNGKGFYYKNRIHNHLLLGNTATMTTPVVVWHHGYNVPVEQMIAKYKYRIEILKEDLKDSPNDPTLWHHAAVNYRAARDLKGAIAASKKALELAKDDPEWDMRQFSWTRFVGAICMVFEGSLEQAREEALIGIVEWPMNMDFYYLLCKLEYDKGNYEKAIAYGRSYLKLQQEWSGKTTGIDFHFDTINLESHVFSMVQDSLMHSGGFNGLLMEMTNGIGQNETNS